MTKEQRQKKAKQPKRSVIWKCLFYTRKDPAKELFVYVKTDVNNIEAATNRAHEVISNPIWEHGPCDLAGVTWFGNAW